MAVPLDTADYDGEQSRSACSPVTVSLVVPTYNRGAALEKTIASILDCKNDGLGEIEVLVVDDGSGAPASRVVDAMKPPDGFTLRCLRQENAGPAAARNRGFQCSSGRLVIFVDDDILVPPDFIEAHDRAHRDRPGSVVYGRCRFVEPERTGPAFRYIDSLEADWSRSQGEPYREMEVVASGQLSVVRKDFADGDRVYDSGLSTPAAEEFELAHRALDRGVGIIQALRIVAEHDSPVDIEGICLQQFKYGIGCAEVAIKRPSVLALDGLSRHLRFSGLSGRLDPAGSWVHRFAKLLLSAAPCRWSLLAGTRFLERIAPGSHMLPRVYRKLIALYFVAGVRRGERLFSTFAAGTE